MTIDLKTLSKEKEYLVKQVEFLEKVNYDDKTRNIQSYREKTLGEELFKARAALKQQQPPQEAALISQIECLKSQVQVAED